MREREQEVADHDEKSEVVIEKLHAHIKELEADVKAARSGEAQQSQIWKDKATKMVVAMQEDAMQEQKYWKDMSLETIEKVTRKMQVAYSTRVKTAATRWMVGFMRAAFRELLIENHLEAT